MVMGTGIRFWKTNGEVMDRYRSEMNVVFWVLKSMKLRRGHVLAFRAKKMEL